MKHSIGGQLIKTGKEIFDKLDSKVNFSIPENTMSYLGINGRKNDKELTITEDNFRLQIGKMDKHGDTIYNKDILLPAINYLLKKIPEGQQAVIQLWPDLARYLTNDEAQDLKKNILTYDEEKQNITKIIKKIYPKVSQKFLFKNISEEYPELFNGLKLLGKESLFSDQVPVLDRQNFSAQQIAKYLYRHTQRNPKLMQLFYVTKTPAQKQADFNEAGQNQSDYYSLIEVAIRLYEVVSGISIQGGIDRQAKYDKIIGGILQWKDVDEFKIKDCPELQSIHNLAHAINPELVFDRLWIDTKGVREAVKQKESLSKLKIYTGAAAIALLGVLAGGIGQSKYAEYKQEKDKKEMLKENLKDKHASNVYLDFRERSGSDNPGLSFRVDGAASEIYNEFLEIYGIGSGDTKVLKSLARNYFLIHDDKGQLINLNSLYTGGFDSPENIVEQLKKFVSEYRQFLYESGFNLEPYKDLQQYKAACQNVLHLKGDLQVSCQDLGPAGIIINVEKDETKNKKEYDELLSELKRKGFKDQLPVHTYGSTRYGKYVHTNWDVYDVLILYDRDNQPILMAHKCTYQESQGFNIHEAHLYTKQEGEIIANDFLKHRAH